VICNNMICNAAALLHSRNWLQLQTPPQATSPVTVLMAVTVLVAVQVYDVTAFWPAHPGGRVILTYAGRDATDVFATFHSAASWALLREHLIGELASEVRAVWAR